MSNEVLNNKENTNEAVVSIQKEILEELDARLQENIKKHIDVIERDKGKLDLSVEKDKIEKKQNLVQFVKVLSGSAPTGSYLVPIEFETSVLEKLNEESLLRRLASVIPMSTDTLKLNALVGYPQVSIVGEGAQIPDSEPVFADITLKARKYACITGATSELFDDNELDNGSLTTLMDIMISSFVTALADKEEQEFINSNASGSEGILKVPGTTVVSLPNTKTSFSDLTWNDLIRALSALQDYSVAEARNATFIMHPTVFGELAQKAQVNDMSYYRILSATGGANTPFADIMGVPIMLSNAMPSTSEGTQADKKFVALAFWKRHAFIGDRLGVKVDVSLDGSIVSGSSTYSAFQNDMKFVRLVKRTGFVTALQSGIVTIKTAAS